MNCSFCGQRTVSIANGPNVRICDRCVAARSDDTDAGLCSFCGLTAAERHSWFQRRLARRQQPSAIAICRRCLAVAQRITA